MASPAGRGQEETEKLWQRYRETGDRELRDQLVLTYVPLVRHLAYRKVRELPRLVRGRGPRSPAGSRA